MWLMTPRGFYSVVSHPNDPTLVLVRARARVDLEALHDFVSGLEIHETPQRDYGWRAAVSRSAWSAALVLLAAEIDYPNFKAAVATREGAKRAHIYGNVWATLLEIQRP